MVKTTSDISEIPVFASMWNMDGLILMGFCELTTLVTGTIKFFRKD